MNMTDNPYQAPKPVFTSESDVAGGLQIAGFWQRVFAFGLDLILLPIVYLAYVFFVIQWEVVSGDISFKIFAVSKVVLIAAYFVYANAASGMTPGKWIMQIRVCRINGLPHNFGVGFMRTLPVVVICVAWQIIIMLYEPPGWTIYAPLGQDPESVREHRISMLGSFMMIYAFSALVCVLLTKRKQALHDLLPATIVVKGRRAKEPYALSDA